MDMSASLNRVELLGYTCQDAEVRFTASGTPVANFSVATNEVWTGKDGKKQEKVEFHRIVAWGKLAELCGQYMPKGRQVLVEGKLQTRKWEDKEGQTRYSTEIQATSVKFLGKAPDKSEEVAEEPPPMTDEVPC
jgi:single-strand DNA-binding protein